MTIVNILERDFNALLDSGSVRSFIQRVVGDHCRAHNYQPQGTGLPIRLANGTEAPVRDWYNIPIKIGDTKAVQIFGVMPDLTVDVLIGIDAIEQFRVSIPPPPRREKGDTCGCDIITEDEEKRFKDFLAVELAKFKYIRGPTDLTEHRIRLKNDTPVKQRYRPRNPAMQQIIDEEVAEMERAGVIEPSQSRGAHPS